MSRAAGLRLQPGERRVMVLRRHWWTMVRPLLWLLPLFLALLVFAVTEYYVPGADLARFSAPFLVVDLVLSGAVLLKWLGVDFAAWYADTFLITTHRIIGQQGVITVERREATLHAIQESNYTISGASARVFDYGDLKLQTGSRGGSIVFTQIPHPRKVQALIAAHARAAREAHVRMHGKSDSDIQAALTRIFNGTVDQHDSPTVALPQITRLHLRAQRRLSLLPQEAILYTSRRHSLLLWKAVVPPLAIGAIGVGAVIALQLAVTATILLVCFAILAIWAVWGLLDWLDDLYVITTDRIIELRRTPLVFELRNAVQLRAVQDVVLRISSFSGRLFNIGALTIELGGADPLRLVAVPHPDRVQRMIFEGLEAAMQRDRLLEQEHLAGTLTEWFEEYHKMQSGN
jgi:hypothetical protein